MLKFKINFKNFNFHIFFVFFFLFLINIVEINSQTTANSTGSSAYSLNSANMDYNGVLGVGWGVFSIIVAAIIGLLCCIFGIATVFPTIFIVIGFLLPILTFLFMIIVPLNQPGNLNLEDNPAVNNYIVARWLFFTVMLISLCLLIVPLYSVWTLMLIPQRVDSRAQREYHEKYEKLMAEEKEKLQREKEEKLKASNAGNANLDVNPNNRNNNNNNQVILPINQNIELPNIKPQADKKKRTINLRRKVGNSTQVQNNQLDDNQNAIDDIDKIE